ncbi:MAG: nitrite reductase small subunit NirD [Flavobacteriales bacterium]|nr:nitrite reductase small subunit NirD [Flavobacteriales bacterium]
MILENYKSVDKDKVVNWFEAGKTSDFDENGGNCIKYKNLQIAVFNFTRKNKWYACQNLCPHKLEMVLSRGMIGSENEIPKVACPLHKKTFSLENGKSLSDENLSIATFPVKIENEKVLVGFDF